MKARARTLLPFAIEVSVSVGLLLSVLACGGGGGGSAGATPPLSAGDARLLTLEYGRLVDVFGLVTGAEGVSMELYRSDVVIGSDILDQRTAQVNRPDRDVTYDFLNSDPDNLQPRLLIPREIGEAEFSAAFDALDDNLRQVNGAIFGQDPNQNNPFTVVPRNAALRLLFSSSLGVLDDFFYSTEQSTGRITGIKNSEAVQLLEIAGDPTDADDRGDFKVIVSRIIVRDNELIIDPVLLGTEGIQLQTRNNAAGLPKSPDQLGANIRVAIALEGPLAIDRVAAGVGSIFVGKNNSAKRSVVRDFRSGNPDDNSADLARGFIRDPNPPRIIGELLMLLERVDTVKPGVQRLTLYKNSKSHEIDRGDVLRIIDPATDEVFAVTDVVEDPVDDHGDPGVQHVRVLVRQIAGLEAIDPSNQPGFPLDFAERERWLRLMAPRVVLIAEFTASREDPVSGKVTGDDPINFLTFTPEPLPLVDGSPSPGNENISPFAGVLMRFSKPVDMHSVRPLDSFFLATRDVLDQVTIRNEFVIPHRLDEQRFFADYRDKFITPHLVVSRIFDQDGSQTSVRLQPAMGLYLDEEMRSIDEGVPFVRKRFAYFLHVLGGPRGIFDLAGNQLDFQSEVRGIEFLSIPFSLDTRRMPNDPEVPMFEDNLVVSVARRYADSDEDEQPSVYLDTEMPLRSGVNQRDFPHMLVRVDDVFGEATYLSDGRLMARGTSRVTKVVDNLNQQSPPPQGEPLGWCPSQVVGLFNSTAMMISSTAANPFFNGGIQNPFNPFGARLQSVWREVDFSLSRLNPSDFNLDVEQMYWAPYSQSPITFDVFDRISLFLGHSEQRPEPCLGAGNALPFFISSGLGKIFADNYAANIKAGSVNEKEDSPPPHPAYEHRNLVINAASAITEPNGLNRFLPLPEFRKPYFVWRDETSKLQGGAAGALTGSTGGFGYDTVGQRYAPYIASPFLGGSGRLVTRTVDFDLVTNTGFWGNADGGSLRGDVSQPQNSVIGGSNLVEKFTDGTVGAIALPLLADFQTYPDDPDLPAGGGFIATGFNGWQVSIPVQSSPYPAFRSLSGGFAGNSEILPVLLAPGTLGWKRALGGYTLNGSLACTLVSQGGVNAGALICGLDNSVYWVMADFLKRQSVVTSGFVELLNPHRMPPRHNGSGDPRLGPYFSKVDGSFELPPSMLPSFAWMTEPPLDALPAGTSIVPEFRAASRLEDDEGNRSAGRGLPEGFWRWGFHDPALAGLGNIYDHAERPDDVNFPLNPLTAGDAHIRKWDQRIQPESGRSRDYWAYYYNRQVTDYTTNLDDLSDERFLSGFVGPTETFGPREVKYLNWRLVMSNNVEVNPPVSPSLESFAVTYRFEKR